MKKAEDKKVYQTPMLIEIGAVLTETKGKPKSGTDAYNRTMCNPGNGDGDLWMCGTPYQS